MLTGRSTLAAVPGTRSQSSPRRSSGLPLVLLGKGPVMPHDGRVMFHAFCDSDNVRKAGSMKEQVEPFVLDVPAGREMHPASKWLADVILAFAFHRADGCDLLATTTSKACSGSLLLQQQQQLASSR